MALTNLFARLFSSTDTPASPSAEIAPTPIEAANARSPESSDLERHDEELAWLEELLVEAVSLGLLDGTIALLIASHLAAADTHLCRADAHSCRRIAPILARAKRLLRVGLLQRSAEARARAMLARLEADQE